MGDHQNRITQGEEEQKRGALALLDAMDRRNGVAELDGNPASMPPGFLEQYAAQYEEDGLAEVILPIGLLPSFAIGKLEWKSDLFDEYLRQIYQ